MAGQVPSRADVNGARVNVSLARSGPGDSQISAIPIPLGKPVLGKLNFRFRRSICQSRLMLDERLIAFARHSLQRATVQYFNDASRVGDNALILYLTGHLCHRCPSHSQHIGKQFLRQRNGIARRAIGRLQ